VPNYAYRARDPESSSCDACGEGFEVLQALSDDPLQTCPECEAPVRRVIGGAQCVLNPTWDTKKKLSDGNLKRLGFKKLVKEGDGQYRDVLAD